MQRPDGGTGDLDARLRAALAASRELGSDYDSAMADSIRRLVAEHDSDGGPPATPMPKAPARRVAAPGQVVGPGRRGRAGHYLLAAFSMVLAIPLSAIAGHFGHLSGLIVCWLGIVLVNLATRLSWQRTEARH